MAPTNVAITGVLRQIVYYHLDNLAYENALFFAERLHAQDRSSNDGAHILALCHLRLGDAKSAIEVSKSASYRGTHLGCAYVYAQACLDLDRYKDGILALEKSRSHWANKNTMGKHSASARIPHPDAAAVSCLLGKLYRAYDDKKKAVAHFEEALRTNPFMWDAFSSLCDMGVSIKVPNIFKMGDPIVRAFDADMSSTLSHLNGGSGPHTREPSQKRSALQSMMHDSADPFDELPASQYQDTAASGTALAEPRENPLFLRIPARPQLAATQSNNQTQDGMETPTAPTLVVEPQVLRQGFGEPPPAPSRRTRAMQAVEPSAQDAPPKMGFRGGPRWREKTRDTSTELSDAATRALGLSAAERKRTASGHPVQPRPVNSEEPRRSARLNHVALRTGPPMARQSSVATTAGAAAPRELKKARPPIPRIMRSGSSASSVGRVVSGNRKPVEDHAMDLDHLEPPRAKETVLALQPARPAEPESMKTDEALKWVLELLRKMAHGYLLSSHLLCQDALSTYLSLPRVHHDTPWVLAQMGKAQFEQANYMEAEKFFRRLRILAPTRLQDMEVYSTALWHLGRETELSFLAHELIDTAWDSPHAWCTLGNAWSLTRDHEQALKCFRRAIQLDPKFAYAYTLQGHEHFANEEYDKALNSYRLALASDKRHYNGYYGIGKVYEKLGNYDKALEHFRAASHIHPNHAVLLFCIGQILERQRQHIPALSYFTKAAELAPRATHTRYKKARALLYTGQLHLAQQELKGLADLAPQDARIHYLRGKLAKALGDKTSAVRSFTVALSLDPKASQQIKEAIETLDDDGIDDSSMNMSSHYY